MTLIVVGLNFLQIKTNRTLMLCFFLITRYRLCLKVYLKKQEREVREAPIIFLALVVPLPLVNLVCWLILKAVFPKNKNSRTRGRESFPIISPDCLDTWRFSWVPFSLLPSFPNQLNRLQILFRLYILCNFSKGASASLVRQRLKIVFYSQFTVLSLYFGAKLTPD